MHSKSIGRAWLLAALAVFAAGTAYAQGIAEDYAPADPVFPFPLYSTHPEAGGLFVFTEGVIYRQTNTLKSEPVAFRGFVVTSPVVPDQNLLLIPIPGVTNRALSWAAAGGPDVNQVRGNIGWQPGVKAGLGRKFGTGQPFHRLVAAVRREKRGRRHARTQRVEYGNDCPNPSYIQTSITSPGLTAVRLTRSPRPTLYIRTAYPRFPSMCPRLIRILSRAGASSASGTALALETIVFTQRFDQYQLPGASRSMRRKPIACRVSFGPRISSIWQRFAWTASDLDYQGNAQPAMDSSVQQRRLESLVRIDAGFAHDAIWVTAWRSTARSSALIWRWRQGGGHI